MTDEQLVFRIRGAFDPEAAAMLCAEVCAAPAGTRVVIDFSGATEISIPGLGVLASALGPPGGHWVTVRGLARHHVRLLEYLAGSATGGEA